MIKEFWVYTYDRGGNILNKKKYAYTTGTVGTVQQTIAYTYDSAWKDKLATYNGVTLTHDAGGNLTNDGTWTYSWQAGRELLKMEKTGTKIVYDYDHNGMRVRKTVAGTATNYTLNGKLITHLTNGSDWMHFFYDGQGKPSIVNYNGATYRYLYNLQGDVIGLIDTSGNIVVEYKYDAWGRIIGRAGSLAITLGYLNPFRYRGYVYDEETGLYYLRSRYYNPVWGRFISADVLLGKRGALLSHNLFAYCYNNFVALRDYSGEDCYSLEGDNSGLIGPAICFTVAASPIVCTATEPAVDYLCDAFTGWVEESSNFWTNWLPSAIELISAYEEYLSEARKKPVNLPSSKRIKFDIQHIESGHSAEGTRGPKKDKFPKGVVIEKIIREAYKYAKRVKTQEERVFLRGPWDQYRYIEMWVNTITETIETAWPKNYR